MTTTNPLTNQLLKLLDRMPPSKIHQQSILQPPATTYSTIRQLFNSFKKDNQSRILQNKIYQLKIHDNIPKSSTHAPTPIKLDHLFHTNPNTPQSITHLLTLKNYLPPSLQIEIILLISKQLLKIHDLTTILSLANKLLKSKECLADRTGLYRRVEKDVLGKLLGGFCGGFCQREVREISGFLYGLPVLGRGVLEFVAGLFGRVRDVGDFQSMKLLYSTLYAKIQAQNKQQNSQILLRTLMKITTSQHLTLLTSKTTPIITKSLHKQPLNEQQQTFLTLLSQQSINKMLNYNTIAGREMMGEGGVVGGGIGGGGVVGGGIGEEMGELKEKERNILDFVCVGLAVEVFVEGGKKDRGDKIGQGYKVWKVFIGWYRMNCHIQNWLDYITLKMLSLVQQTLQHPIAACKLIQFLLSQQSSPTQSQQLLLKPTSTSISTPPTPPNSLPLPLPLTLESTISQYLIRVLMFKKQKYTKYFCNKLVRKLIAFGLMIDQSQIYEGMILGGHGSGEDGVEGVEGGDYGDILGECFGFQGVVYQYFRKLLANQNRRANLQKYLNMLFETKPKKLKDLYIKIDSYNSGQIFQIQQHYLLKSLRKLPNPQLITSLLRDMSNSLPSKYTIQIINAFIKTFQNKPQHKIIYSQAVRTLNVILSTREEAELGVQFKKHLKEIVESKVIGGEVFKNVSQGMIKDLAAFYAKQAK